MADDDKSSEHASVAREILSYFAAHPDARDTLEGIVQWWMLERRIHYQASQVERALRSLEEKGLVVKDGGGAYHLNPDRLEDIGEALAGDSGPV